MRPMLSRLVLPWSVKAAGDAGAFTGYLATFGNVDSARDACAKGCFARTLGEHKAAGTMPGLFWDHDRGEPIGEWTGMAEDERGLLTEGRLWIGAGIPKAEQAWRMITSKGPKGLSIGYRTKNAAMSDAGVRTLLDVDLVEGSITPFPVNDQAVILAAKSAADLIASIHRTRAVLAR